MPLLKILKQRASEPQVPLHQAAVTPLQHSVGVQDAEGGGVKRVGVWWHGSVLGREAYVYVKLARCLCVGGVAVSLGDSKGCRGFRSRQTVGAIAKRVINTNCLVTV